MAFHHRTIYRLLSKWTRPRSRSYYRLSPSLPKKRRFILLQDNKIRIIVSSSSKNYERRVPVLAGSERKVFWLEHHILQHWLLQHLLQNCCPLSELERLQVKDADFRCYSAKVRKSNSFRPILFQCDSLLFEFFVWLIENDDPSLRNLDPNDLIDFYDA